MTRTFRTAVLALPLLISSSCGASSGRGASPAVNEPVDDPLRASNGDSMDPLHGKPLGQWRRELLDEGTRFKAAEELAGIGAEAVPVLLDLLGDERAFHVSDHRRALESAGYAAIKALGRIGPAAVDAVPVLVSATTNRDPSVAAAAAHALGAIGHTTAPVIQALVVALGDEDEFVSVSAALALKAFGPASAPAAAELGDIVLEGGDLAYFAAEALGAIGEAAAPAGQCLALALAHQDCTFRWIYADALGRIGPSAAAFTPALTKALGDSDPLVREAAASALAASESNRDE